MSPHSCTAQQYPHGRQRPCYAYKVGFSGLRRNSPTVYRWAGTTPPQTPRWKMCKEKT